MLLAVWMDFCLDLCTDAKVQLLLGEHFSKKGLQVFYYAPNTISWIFALVSLQLYVGEQERISSFKSSLSLLSALLNQALSDLIKEAKKAYQCSCLVFRYCLVILGEQNFCYPFLAMKQLVSCIMWVTDSHSFYCSPFQLFPQEAR